MKRRRVRCGKLDILKQSKERAPMPRPVMFRNRKKYDRRVAKGIVIPKQARDIFGIQPGDTLLILGDEERGIAIQNKAAFSGLFAETFDKKNGGDH